MRVFFLTEYDYQKQIRKSLNQMNDVILAKTFPNNKFWYYHTSIKVNHMLNLPFKNVWYNKYFQIENCEDVQYIYFSEYVSPAYDKTYLKFLKRRFPHAKLVFALSNPINKENTLYVKSILDSFDFVTSFDEDDVKKHGFVYFNGLYEPDPNINPTQRKSDIFFAGRGKSRLNYIHELYIFLSSQNIKCDFYLFDVPFEKQLKNSDIHYNEWLPYPQLLQHVVNTNVVLEILQDAQTGYSMRTCEAITYKKRLVTNNVDLIKQPFFNPKYMKILSSVCDFDSSFIKNSDEPLYYDADFSVNRFVAFLDQLCGK
jgi:hypothetical protein